MDEKQTLWVHPASFTYSFEEPSRLIETIWAERPGWGYIRRRDIWVKKQCSAQELAAKGLVVRKPVGHEDVYVCPYCGMYICSIPGALISKHVTECGGSSEDWRKLEEMVVHEQRIKKFQAALQARKQRQIEELEEEQKRERFERIRDETQARQQAKDRKKRLREETREELRRR